MWGNTFGNLLLNFVPFVIINSLNYDKKVQVPDLISTIKSAGLLLATFGPANAIESNITLQEKFGVDAILNEGILRVKRHSEWN